MQKINRRFFCGTSLLALPLLNAFSEEDGFGDVEVADDPVMDTLAAEFAATTMDGARGGFSGEHYRSYASQIRIFDAHQEAKGTNRKVNRKLDEDDFYLLNRERTVRMTIEYWQQRGILINEQDLTALTDIDEISYREIKKALKKQGGIQKLHARVALSLERRAEEFRNMNLQGRLKFRDGYLLMPSTPGEVTKNNMKNVQYYLPDLGRIGIPVDTDLNCLCKALTVEGAILSILCATVCPPCCVPAALMVALATLLESLDHCDPNLC